MYGQNTTFGQYSKEKRPNVTFKKHIWSFFYNKTAGLFRQGVTNLIVDVVQTLFV